MNSSNNLFTLGPDGTFRPAELPADLQLLRSLHRKPKFAGLLRVR